MHVKYKRACEFMFYLNKASRSFLVKNDSTVRNEFINNGLIEYQLSLCYDGYKTLERLYFEALKRNKENRILTIRIKSMKVIDEFLIFY